MLGAAIINKAPRFTDFLSCHADPLAHMAGRGLWSRLRQRIHTDDASLKIRDGAHPDRHGTDDRRRCHDHFGLLGLPQQPISAARIFGAALLISGVVLIQRP